MPRITGVDKSGHPIGAVFTAAHAASIPGALVCNGNAVSRTTYALLFAKIGTIHGSGDGSTTFNLPDYRGRFLRGWANGSGNDPDRASRSAAAAGGATGDNVGSVQGHAVSTHTHTDNISYSDTGHAHGNVVNNGAEIIIKQTIQAGVGVDAAVVNGTGPLGAFHTTNGNAALSKSGGVTGVSGATTSTEARPLNANVNYFISYF